MAERPVTRTTRALSRSGGGLTARRLGIRRTLFADAYHFLLTSSWLRLFALIVVLYLFGNLLFALGYLAGGDCIEGARPGSFTDSYFFSVQTMATIGYGKMVPRTTYANVLVTVEALTGLMWLALATGLIFAKFSRPTARVMFSKVAVISPRDGVPSLMFRLANVRGNQIVEATIKVVMARSERTVEGEQIRRFYTLDLSRNTNATFALTWTVVHPITDKSPLHGFSTQSFEEGSVELIVSLVGIDESTSATVHARFSYVADEIVCNARLIDILSRTPEGQLVVDYTHFHDHEPFVAAKAA